MDFNQMRPRFTPLWWLNADTRYIEVYSALLAAIFGTLLLLPNSMFTEFRAYHAMSVIMPEWAWGVSFLLCWILQSYAMCGNVFLARLPSAFLSFSLWGLTASCFLWSSPAGFAAYPPGLLAVLLGWVVLKGPTNGEH